MDVKFGTSGLRGLSVELVGIPSALYLTAFCRFLEENNLAKKGDPILVAQDFRISSPQIAAICYGAIESSGFVPIDCGAIPTPALALEGLKIGAASIMITGSHIPADRNGIKFYLPTGEISKTDELAIIGWADKLSANVEVKPSQAIDDKGRAAANFMLRNAKILPENALSGFKVGVYQHSTVGRDLLADILSSYGAQVILLGRSDSFISVDTEALSHETVTLLQGWASQHKLDAVVSADGDADRPLVADETGTPLRGDLLGLITANFLGAKVVVTPITSNSGIEKNAAFEVVRTRVGSPYVIAGMNEAMENNKTSIVGFEANGGFLSASPFTLEGNIISPLPTRDCFLPILTALYSAVKNGKTLSTIAKQYALPIADAERVEHYAQKRSTALMNYLLESDQNLAAFLAPIGTVKHKSNIDGLRVTLSDDCIIHLRPSGNAPEMRCYVEAHSPSEAENLLKRGLELIENFADPEHNS